MSQVSHARLVQSLSKAMPLAKKTRSVDNQLLWDVRRLEGSPESALPEFRELLSTIQDVPELVIFDDATQVGPQCPLQVDYLFLLYWLISHGQNVGVELAVADLNKYLCCEEIELTEIVCFDGIRIDASIEIEGWTIVPFSKLRLTDAKNRICVKGTFGMRMPTAALCRIHRVSRQHQPAHHFPTNFKMCEFESGHDTLRCLTVSNGVGFRLMHHWFEPPEFAPWAVDSIRYLFDDTQVRSSVVLTSEDAKKAQVLAEAFLKLDNPKKARFRIPMDRLKRSYLTAWDPVNSAIELGIALESLVAPKKLSREIMQTIKNRTAQFVGVSCEDKVAVKKIVDDVYELRSGAIHSGSFDSNDLKQWCHDITNVLRVLQVGRELVSKLITKSINQGEPNWVTFDSK